MAVSLKRIYDMFFLNSSSYALDDTVSVEYFYMLPISNPNRQMRRVVLVFQS